MNLLTFFLEYDQKLKKESSNALLNQNRKETKSLTSNEGNSLNGKLATKINGLVDIFQANNIDILPFFPNFEENLK